MASKARFGSKATNAKGVSGGSGSLLFSFSRKCLEIFV
jgi:hypothetical protein